MDIIQLERGEDCFVRPILEALPQWFGIEAARETYIAKARQLPTMLCRYDGREVGFLSLKTRTPSAMEVVVLGVLPAYHRRGIGRALMGAAEDYAKRADINVLTVKTLSARHSDRTYGMTRAFYRAVGFLAIEELPDHWGPANPCPADGQMAGLTGL